MKMPKLIRQFVDAIEGKAVEDRACETQVLDEKIDELRKKKHDLANRTDVIQLEAYWRQYRNR
jgi:hypothetical protein